MKADSTTCIPDCCASSLSAAHTAQIIPSMQMFLDEKKLLIIDQRNAAPGGKYRVVARRLGQV